MESTLIHLKILVALPDNDMVDKAHPSLLSRFPDRAHQKSCGKPMVYLGSVAG
jgi:hypothetical protein